jgi:hypothetical protein
LGRGINFSIEVADIDKYYEKLKSKQVSFYRALKVNTYQVELEAMEQKEFLLQDPSGYLLRFTN